ncbi:MAG: 2-dehydropantoate 2-reductase [Paraglaciecola sp.]|uniref:ketopantoate reductase family protein n=1 Tax=Paraglaciecola sp. TaxID=1920173 RepID=UPI0032983BB9
MQNNSQVTCPKLAIVGSGAIGGLIGFKCRQLGYDYQHLVKSQQSPIHLTDISGESHSLTPKISLISKPQPFDLLILPVKAYQVLAVLKQLHSYIHPQHLIVLLHNGMGTIEQVKEMLPNNPLIAATTSYGAFKPDTNTLIETGLGQTHLGWINDVDETVRHAIEPILSALLPPSHWHQDISLALWKKLAVNAVINPLTAIYNIKNGELTNAKYQETIHKICDEVSSVMGATGYSVSKAELVTNVRQVISATANNYSSMHQDIKHNRPSEIDFINGYVTAKATTLQIEVPYNQRMLEQIKLLE